MLLMQAVEIVKESLPLAAQWGLLGVLSLALGVSTIYLSIRLDKARTDHAAQIDRIRQEHKIELLESERRSQDRFNLVQERRISEAGSFATALHEIVDPLSEAIDQVQAVAEDLTGFRDSRSSGGDHGPTTRKRGG